MHNALGDFKYSAYSWNTEAGHLAQGKHVGGEPVHEHRLDEKEEEVLGSCVPGQLAGRLGSQPLSHYLPRGNGWLWARLPGASI